MDEAMLEKIPKTRTQKMKLAFSATENMYKSAEVEESAGDMTFNNDAGATIVMKTSRGGMELYNNVAEARKVQLREFAGKKFLIEDSLRQTPWKLSGDTKEIKGYLCQKATFTRMQNGKPQNVVAWYTLDIPVSAGPEGFGGLPGLILEAIVGDAQSVITATNVEFRALKKDEIKIPSGGKKVTEAEFRKIMDEYAKEMQSEGGQNIRIIRH